MAVTFSAKDGVLHIIDGENTYLSTAEGLISKVEDGVAATKLEGKAAKNLLDKALIEIEKNPAALSKEAKTALVASIDHFKDAQGTNRFAKIKKAVETASQLERVGDLQAAEGLYKANPLADSFLTEAGEKKLASLKFDRSAIQAELKLAAENITKVKGLNESLAKLMTEEKPSAKAVNDFLKANQAHLAELDPGAEAITKMQLNGGGYDFSKVKADYLAKIKTQVTEAETLVADLIKHRSVVNLNDDAEAVKKAAEEVTKIEEKLVAIQKDEFGNAVKSGMKKELVKELGEVHPEFASKFGAAVNAAEKTAWGLSNGLKHKGVMGALWKNRGIAGKGLVVAGAGAVVYTIVSAIGGKGPGERAEAVTKSREADAAMAR